jgi:hypothetical protein
MSKQVLEGLRWLPKWTIKKYANDADAKAGKAYEVSEFEGNLLTNAGMNRIWELVCGDAVDDLATAPVLIVGTGSGAATVNDVEGTFTSGVKVAVDGSYPTFGTDQKATWMASFDGSTANQAWNEFGLLTKASSGVLINRKVSSQGTKISGQTWELTLEITLSNPA